MIALLQHTETKTLVTIELKHLRYAEVAERCGSFRKAADLLTVKQSNLSRRVRHLEEELGVALFERTSGGVRATAAGRDLINGVRRVLDDLQTIVDRAKAVHRGEAGYLTIGFYTSLSAGNLRASLVEYCCRYPHVEIVTVEGPRARLFDGIHNGTVDIAVVAGEPASDRNRSMVLWSERVIVALPEDHPLAAHEIIYWTDLKHERFLLSARDSCPEIQDIIVSRLASPGDRPNVVKHDVSPENIKSLVGAGCGVSLMCEASMGATYAGVVYREARDGNGTTRIGYSAFWKERNDNPALRSFIRLLEDRFPPISNGSESHGASSRSPDPSR